MGARKLARLISQFSRKEDGVLQCQLGGVPAQEEYRVDQEVPIGISIQDEVDEKVDYAAVAGLVEDPVRTWGIRALCSQSGASSTNGSRPSSGHRYSSTESKWAPFSSLEDTDAEMESLSCGFQRAFQGSLMCTRCARGSIRRASALLSNGRNPLRRMGFLRWACLDLNQGPHPYQGCALTRLSYRPERQER